MSRQFRPRRAGPGVAVAMLTVLVMLAGCATAPRAIAPPPATTAPPHAVTTTRGDFTIAASMLDTWNAVGQILVRTDGVTYEGRSQMLGIYAVRFRGENLLVVTRALVMTGPGQGMLTRVDAVLKDGKASSSAASRELLGLLQQRLPGELAYIAAGGRR